MVPLMIYEKDIKNIMINTYSYTVQKLYKTTNTKAILSVCGLRKMSEFA